MTPCPKCGKPMYEDQRYVSFCSNTVPAHSLSVKLIATWCPHPEHHTTTVVLVDNKTAKVP